MARRIRLRSSAGWVRFHSGLGTEPNIEPPSSHRKPVSSAWTRHAPMHAGIMRAEWPKAPRRSTAGASFVRRIVRPDGKSSGALPENRERARARLGSEGEAQRLVVEARLDLPEADAVDRRRAERGDL